MSNLSVNSPKTPVPAAPAAQAPAQPKPTPAELRDPEHLVQTPARPDQSQAKAPAAGSAVQSVNLVDTPATPSQADIEWALKLESKVKNEHYEPKPEELTRYQKIAKAVQAAEPQPGPAAPAAVSPEDLAWAQELETKIKTENYQPKPEETARYEKIFQAYQAANAQPQPAAPGGAPAPVGPAATEPPKAPVNLKAKFEELDSLMAKKQYIIAGAPAEPEKVRQTAVQIWLDGKDDDRLKLAQKLVAHGQSEVLGRVLTHQETSELEAAQLMGNQDFPVGKFINLHAWIPRALAKPGRGGIA